MYGPFKGLDQFSSVKPMASRRIERLNEQLKREITTILRNEVKDPRVGWATVTAARVTPDLSLARIFVSILGEEAEKEEALAGLRAAASFIRTELGRSLRLRRVPELRFEIDRSLDYAMRIERLLHEALPADDHGSGGASEGGESSEVEERDEP